MTIAHRRSMLLVASTVLLAALAACDGQSSTNTGGSGATIGDGGAGATSQGGDGGEGGLFQTAQGGSTTGSTTSSKPPDPTAICESSSPTTPSTLWSKKAGAADVQSTLCVTADGAGNVIVVGNFVGAIDFGAGVLTSAGQNDAYVAKLDPNGGAVWSKRFGDSGYHQYAQHVAADGQGNILVTGHFRGSVDFGGGALNDVYNFFEDLFIAKLDGTGKHLWSKRYGDINQEESQAIAADAQGNVLVVGAFQKTIDFGAGPLVAEDGGFNGFVAKLSALGDQQWAKSLGDMASEQKTIGVTADAQGNVYIVGYHKGSIDLGGGALTAEGATQSAYVAKLSPTGTYQWAKSWASTNLASALDVAVDGAGNVYVLGNFKGVADFGGGDFDAGTGNNVFLVKLDATGGYLWSKSFGTKAGADEATSLDLHGDNPVLFGAFTTKIDFGGGELAAVDGYDVFLVELDEEGCQIHARSFGGPKLQRGETMDVDASGNIVFGGSFDASVDFGAGALTADGTDAYVAKSKP